jgi:hypothetical protein
MRVPEFVTLLSACFTSVQFFGQTTVFGSFICPSFSASRDTIQPSLSLQEGNEIRWVLSLDDLKVQEASASKESLYLFAVASDEFIPALRCSFMEYDALPNPASSLLGGIQERDRRIRELEHALSESTARQAECQSDVQAAVCKLFSVFLDREPTGSELAHFASTLGASGSLAQVVDTFSQAKEFRSAREHSVKLFVPPGHFYSPVTSSAEIAARVPRVRPLQEATFLDVPLDIDDMTRFWETTLAPIVAGNRFPVGKSRNFRYRFENPAFSYADAIILEAMILHFRPSRIIEVGSGWSTACILDVLAASQNLDSTVACIEPYPALLNELMWPEDQERVRVIASAVQQVDTLLFDELQCDDILFIDSTHVLKTGSDVEFELSHILPALQEGVIIHFHDIFYPFEYGYQWAVEENRSWNEIYALRHFLAFNNEFEVLFFNDMFSQLRRPIIERDCPKFLLNSGGSIWLRRRYNSGPSSTV